MASPFKFFGEQDPRHGDVLAWPGVFGIPYRGKSPPIVGPNELENLPIVAEAHHALFDLSDPEQSEKFRWIRDRIRNGLFTLDYIERHWDDAAKKMWVYIEWSQLYAHKVKTEKIQDPYYFSIDSNDKT